MVLKISPTELVAELQNQEYSHQVNALDSTKRTPLHWAVTRADEDAARRLLKAGADVNARDNLNGTPLTLAGSTGSTRILELLILHGANVHAKTSIGSQAIHHASRHQTAMEPVQILLRAGASLNSRNKFGHSPLSGAAICNCHEIVKFLLDKGADIHVRSLHGDTPLFETIFHNCHESLQILLESGANPHDVNNAGSTIFHAAALEADTRTLEILCNSGIKWDGWSLRDANGYTPLEIVERRIKPHQGFLEAFEKLLDATG